MGVQDLGFLHYKAFKDAHGSILLLTVNNVKVSFMLYFIFLLFLVEEISLWKSKFVMISRLRSSYSFQYWPTYFPFKLDYIIMYCIMDRPLKTIR